MLKKNIFYKRKKNVNNFFFVVVVILILLAGLILVLTYSKQEFFDIPEFKSKFYIIPDDRGGTKVLNLDKKALHLQDTNNTLKIFNDPILEYSIQIFASDNYQLVKKKLNFIINKNYKTQNKQDYVLNEKYFFIFAFIHELDKEFILLYKNFTSRDLAFDYCSKYLNFLSKCLIVNAQNLD